MVAEDDWGWDHRTRWLQWSGDLRCYGRWVGRAWGLVGPDVDDVNRLDLGFELGTGHQVRLAVRGRRGLSVTLQRGYAAVNVGRCWLEAVGPTA